jgi:hypothetical protein
MKCGDLIGAWKNTTGLITQASAEGDMEHNSQLSDIKKEDNQGKATNLACNKSKRTEKAVQPCSPEELRIRRGRWLPAGSQRTPNQKREKAEILKKISPKQLHVLQPKKCLKLSLNLKLRIERSEKVENGGATVS